MSLCFSSSMSRFGFCIMSGSVETSLRWGGKLCTRLIAKAISIAHDKFHCNRLTTIQDIQNYASKLRLNCKKKCRYAKARGSMGGVWGGDVSLPTGVKSGRGLCQKFLSWNDAFLCILGDNFNINRNPISIYIYIKPIGFLVIVARIDLVTDWYNSSKLSLAIKGLGAEHEATTGPMSRVSPSPLYRGVGSSNFYAVCCQFTVWPYSLRVMVGAAMGWPMPEVPYGFTIASTVSERGVPTTDTLGCRSKLEVWVLGDSPSHQSATSENQKHFHCLYGHSSWATAGILARVYLFLFLYTPSPVFPFFSFPTLSFPLLCPERGAVLFPSPPIFSLPFHSLPVPSISLSFPSLPSSSIPSLSFPLPSVSSLPFLSLPFP